LTNNSSHSSRRWLKLFLTTGSKIGLGLFLPTIVAIGIGQWWAKDNLAPIIEQELAKSLKRPIKIGKIEDIGINQIHLSNANIPANGSDLNQITIRDVFVNFNPFQLLLDRTVKLDIHLVTPSKIFRVAG
jgi:translocation and assembly module TamB